MNIPDRTDHSPEFMAPDDERPQFACLPFEKRQEIICDLINDHMDVDCSLIAEVISQMNSKSSLCDLFEEIAKYVDKHDPQEGWTI